jgi:hypothetical protein
MTGSSDQIRRPCFYSAGRVLVITHGFVKQSEAVQERRRIVREEHPATIEDGSERGRIEDEGTEEQVRRVP